MPQGPPGSAAYVLTTKLQVVTILLLSTIHFSTADYLYCYVAVL